MSIIMGDPKTVLEGSVKYRDKKKWKSRWAVISKLSPVADCLHIQLYRDSKERCKNGPTKASLSLEEFLGMETGFTLDKESNTMAIICAELVVVLAFDNRELLIQWQVKIRANLVEEQQFLVQIAHVPTKSKLPCGPARLHLQDHTFCLVSSVPPRLLGTWPIKELRRFGVIEGKFCFEGGSLCGRGEGLHVLLTNQSADLAQAMDLASKGKLLGKRKTLTRKNSVLETSSRMPLHKRNHHDSSKSTTSDSSHRLLLSSGSECSTCDACSEILRSGDPCGDDCMVYTSSASSIKASSCRIHYRWPSCLSRWGQSSTTTASDVESMDTVSVTLSDFQGPSNNISKSNGHGQSLSCLCDSQGTWPFNQCTKCGRQFYSRNSLQSCRDKQIPSPENGHADGTNGFSPQWTMDSLVGSTSECESKKDTSYQLMNPPSDRASLCSHASHSSSASVASSSGSEYSVPRNYLEQLYDKPKSVQHALNGTSNGKVKECRRANSANDKPMYIPPENCVLCPCHEPIKDWVTSTLSTSQDKLVGSQECVCWNKLAMSARNEMDMRIINGRKSASANASPNSSPKKTKYNSGASTLRSGKAMLDGELACTCGKNDPYANYAIPKSAMHINDFQQQSTHTNGCKDSKTPVPSFPAEDYDVPKKFTDLLSNCDMTQKASAIKTIANGPSCSCMSACKMVQNIELFKMASKHSYNHKHGSVNPPSADALQMCACQRVMMWAGTLVPCLGPQRQSLETGWQCVKSFATDGKGCSRTWHNNTSAVCCEPPKTAEAMMVNGKVKHVVRGTSVDTEATRAQNMSPMARPRSSTVSYSFSSRENSLESSSYNYANIEMPNETEKDRTVTVTDEPSAVNYANLEFADTLPLYENSNLVLSRLEGDGTKSEPIVTEKPPLPPRSYQNSGSKDNVDKDKCKCVRRSPKKSPLKQTNGSAYEMMCYEKTPCENGDEDYLLMQPLCTKSDQSSPSKLSLNGQNDVVQFSQESTDKQSNKENVESEPTLPLRPFMPYAYPISENGAITQEGNPIEMVSRTHQLINEELQLRAMRSNSLSELKKKIIMRKRSSSVDGKNNSYSTSDLNGETESLPASPICSPRQTAQRKHSIFSKLNLRSKEKSMSTNEIDPIVIVSNESSAFNNVHKSGLHRSADCLKLSEEYANSDDELNSDNSEFGVQKDTTGVMKRSSSVPCRAGVASVAVSSPVRSHETIMELNDLNKESAMETTETVDDSNEIVQRKYSLDSQERPKKRTAYGIKSNCDNIYRQECLDECDTVMEMQGILRRNRHIPSTDRDGVTENYRSATSSCSSSDISDYMESLSFISRSSSSSSGSTSSADYMRSEDLYLLRTLPKPPPKNNLAPSNSISVPSVHQTRNSHLELNGSTNHRNHVEDSSSAGTSSSSSYQEKPCLQLKDELKVRPSSNSASNRDSRSSTSSTSSLSISPSVTDYSSSTSSSPPCQNGLTTKQMFCKGPHESKSEETGSVQQNMFVYSSSKDEPGKT